jgi:hypothetical protein
MPKNCPRQHIKALGLNRAESIFRRDPKLPARLNGTAELEIAGNGNTSSGLDRVRHTPELVGYHIVLVLA